MELALIQAEKCREVENAEKQDGTCPRVGCVVARGNKMLLSGYRGQFKAGEHAEYTVLSKLSAESLEDATLYTTLEPCTRRNHPKRPCCQRIIDARIRHVVIGMVDPDHTIRGHGYWALRQHGIRTEFFHGDLTFKLEELNEGFIREKLALGGDGYNPHFLSPTQRTLDDWYHVVNSVYFDKNWYRSADALFAHLVEVVGGLSLLATDKKKEGVVPEAFVVKALAWWLALCGKVRVKSVEDLLWMKFPGVCSYCLTSPHRAQTCKRNKLLNKNPDWDQLREKGLQAKRPRSLSEWQNMFNTIYPPSESETFENIFGRITEELGELAEAVRVTEVVPGYFISEASDFFAWLMKLINVLSLKAHDPIDIDTAFYAAYPDRCRHCQRRVCACPPIIPSTLGRLTHEGPKLPDSKPGFFVDDHFLTRMFEAGVTHVQIGSDSILVTPDLVKELYEFAADILRCVHEFESDDRVQIASTAQQVLALTSVQRVNQASVDALVRDLLKLPSSSRASIERVLEGAGPVVTAFKRILSTNAWCSDDDSNSKTSREVTDDRSEVGP